MRKITKKIILLLSVFIVSVYLWANKTSVYAEDMSSAMVLSPLNQKVILIPGEDYHGSIRISNPNNASQNLDYSVSVGSFSQKSTSDSIDDYGEVDSETITSYNQIMDWISLESNNGSVPPNSTDIITFTINVPEDAPAGGQYATLLVRDETDYLGEGSGNVSIKNITGIASIIYAEVAGKTHERGEIIENNIPSFLLDAPLRATSMVFNDGNVHTDAEYTLQVWPMFSDEEICTNEEEASTSLVMPETKKYHTEECNLPHIGIFRARQIVKIFGEESILEKIIIKCPTWLLFIIIFAIFAVVMWLISRARLRKKSR